VHLPTEPYAGLARVISGRTTSSIVSREEAMKRLLVLGLVIAGSVGWAGIVGVAGAEVPGPNGRIAFVNDSRRCDDCHAFSVAPDGSGRLRLTDLGVGGPRWSPDGTRLSIPTFTDDGRVGTATMNADGSGFAVLEIPHPTLNVACWGWSPDGAQLACETWDETRPRRPSGVFTVDSADGSDLQRLTKNPFGSGDLPGDFSPDGSRYAFVRFNDERRNGNVALFVVNADGTGVTRLTPWRMNACCDVSWSPDGARLLFNKKGSIYTMATDGSDVTRIPLDTGAGFAFASEPSWSPDGTHFVFTMYLERLDQVDIFTAAADGSDLVQITDSQREDGFPDWGPAA
jgi:Tol biopolymer transport system component